MSAITYDYIETFIRSFIKEDNSKLLELQDYALKNSVPIVQPEVANFLKFMVTIKKPKKILELGTAIGYSALLMNEASGGEAEIVTIERDESMIYKATENINKFNKKDKITVLQGDCLEVLKNMQDNFDMIFIDAGKGHYNHFLPYCLNMLNQDGVIVADNVLFRGMVASRELLIRRKITIVKRMKSYLNEISDRKDLITSILPMGDGVAVTVRRNNDEKA